MKHGKRRAIPASAKLSAALRQLAAFMGCQPGDLECDHDPALTFRPWNEAGDDTIPPANAPEALVWRTRADHKNKTFGPGGARRVTTRGSDIAEPGRLDKIAAKHAEFRQRVLLLAAKPEKRKSKWPKRQFANRKG